MRSTREVSSERGGVSSFGRIKAAEQFGDSVTAEREETTEEPWRESDPSVVLRFART